ncbi:complement C1q tumor necrosis factor-related protein 5-like, partial [Ylistrum balloti]|uniref:complement C1q tumor necrosis factor-related protein 5-like n=1 Tax=Ylistrum balloti TaxID=509963 RepID=UPI002905DC2D
SMDRACVPITYHLFARLTHNRPGRGTIMSALFVFGLLTLLSFASCNQLDLIQRLDDLENEWRQAEAVVSQQASEIQSLTAQLRTREISVGQLKHSISRRQATDQIYGFTARLSQKIAHLNTQQAIVFDQVLTNVGAAYEPSTGIFVCPYSGLYEFAATIVSNGDQKNLDAEIVKNGNRLARLHSTIYGFDQGTQVVIVQCEEGQRVWVRHFGTADTPVLPGGYSTFAGHLIHID